MSIKKLLFINLTIILWNPSFSQIDTTDISIITKINISGNRKTKSNIIIRELVFAVGDTITTVNLRKKINKSKINLLKTPLFNFVDINIKKENKTNCQIKIIVVEHWYLWPEISLFYADRNFSNWLKEWDFNHLDYGGGLVKYNFRGRNEKIDFYATFGYNKLLIFGYNNIFLDKKRKYSVGFNLMKLDRKETSYIIDNDQVKWLRLEDKYALKTYNISTNYNFRNKINTFNSLFIGYEKQTVADTLLQLNTRYFPNKIQNINYLYLKYIFIYDNRNSRIFPTRGFNSKLILAKYGFNIFNKSILNTCYMVTQFSYYYKITNKLYATHYIVGEKYFTQNQPYFLDKALGYSYNVRGYEYNVISGNQFILQKNTINFELLPKTNINLKFIPFKAIKKTFLAIYLSIFADYAYVKNTDNLYLERNTLANKSLYSAGVGISFLTYYDKLLRLEYSLTGTQNKGLYIHFTAPF